ncbi:hypothetical protein AB205_0005230, partial [Aquarana catesbeiana]
MMNTSTVTEFILLGFPALISVQVALFCVFFIFYISTLLGNALILVTTTFSAELHTPMYFFLGNLSLLEIFYTSVTIPKMLFNFLLKTKEEKLVPVFYAVITPTLNPIIYTLRNKDFKSALRKMKGLGYAKF